MQQTAEFPPFHPNQLTFEENVLLRKSTRDVLMQEIFRYHDKGREPGWGFDHHWGAKQIDYGRSDWDNVGRTYRLCYNAEHRDRGWPCTLQWLSEPMPTRFKQILNSYRAIFDMTGGPWSHNSLPAGERVRNQALWSQVDCTTIPALKSIFDRLLPDTDYEIASDESSDNGSDYDEFEDGNGEMAEPKGLKQEEEEIKLDN
ncbi:hypothetical protein K435DRAFT_807069 [Dendrothele bispora CBS 962.96]|uniref:Uncharacterized protein n=1 Tax=Dendrothele bispora (strain CBS 962.96) TaxID=1314807 RepID=A0A4S8L5V4_DENBC|nr:hypothetical protein K435DRAFT_807069 [Dendrothele bispora CBS 962.96]